MLITATNKSGRSFLTKLIYLNGMERGSGLLKSKQKEMVIELFAIPPWK